ncbi:MAG TPA: bifunctional 3-demethylubiquinol 3-O-methyltransferase/2-polyprenyl-6-hydroxyphenol methylase, partial [Gammaproteobacteria bacterium]
LNRHPKAFAFAIVGAEYLFGLLPRGTHEYAKFIKPSELAAWSRDAKLMPDNISGLDYNPINGKHQLNDDPRVNYLMHLRKN